MPAVTLVAALAVGLPATAAHATVATTAPADATVAQGTQTTKQRLDAAVRAYLAKRPKSLVGVAVYDRRTGATYTYRGGWHFKTASVVKVQVLAAVLYRAQRLGRKLGRQRWGSGLGDGRAEERLGVDRYQRGGADQQCRPHRRLRP